MTPDFFMPNSYLSIHIKCIVAPQSESLSPLTFIVLSHPMRQLFFQCTAMRFLVHPFRLGLRLGGMFCCPSTTKSKPIPSLHCDRMGSYKLLKIVSRTYSTPTCSLAPRSAIRPTRLPTFSTLPVLKSGTLYEYIISR